MHFRDRGKSIQLVRTTYDATTKRPKTQIMGRLSPPGYEVTDELKEGLTPEELQEVTAYSANVAHRQAIEREYAAAHFAESIQAATEWLSVADGVAAEHFINEVRRPMRGLRREIARIERAADGDGSDG